MSRKPLIVGNWKMNKTVAQTKELIGQIATQITKVVGVDVGVAPPFLALSAGIEATRNTAIEVFAQNMHEADSGPFTGEVSAPMLLELGVQGVILGHSERRAYFNETDRALALKVRKALDSKLVPLLCVGESEEERDGDLTERRLRQQIQEGLALVTADDLARIVIAYEPIWAIGTGAVATPTQAQEAISFIRALVADIGGAAADQVRILYGGSVTDQSASELLAQPDIDGALVGGASLDAQTFTRIIEAAAAVTAAA